MYKNLEFYIGTALSDFLDFLKRQFAGKNNAGQSEILIEFHCCPVYRICLNRQMNIDIRIGFSYHHNHSRIRHDQRIWIKFNHRLQIVKECSDLGVVRLNVCHYIKFFSEGVSF